MSSGEGGVKFISKQERERLAVERRQQEAEQKRVEAERTRELLRRKQHEQQQQQQQQQSNGHTWKNPNSSEDADRKKKRRNPNGRTFNFEWDTAEDTFSTNDPLYANRSTKLMFGRGKLAGFDTEDLKVTSSSSQYHRGGHSSNSHHNNNRHNDTHSSSSQRRPPKNTGSWRDKPFASLTERDCRIMREEYQISTKGGNIPPPIRRWDESNISYKLLDVIDDIGYRDPTPIQRQAIPIGLQNRDLLGIAETGSGKTAAFLIPMLEFIVKLPPMDSDRAMDGPYSLIMAPTRELAQQIEKETLKFATRLHLKCISIVGGHSIEEQTNKLRRGVEIVIATPGRLRDLLDRRLLVLNQCTYVVMDEADRMVVDMGFEEDLDYILSRLPVTNLKPDSDAAVHADEMVVDGLPTYRQTTMFSATMPPAVERIAKDYMRRPAVVMIGEVGTAALTIKQKIEMTNEDKKEAKLFRVLQEGEFEPPIIVFVRTKDGVEALSQIISNEGFKVATLHGGKSQEMRESALDQIRRGAKDILVATDVAGRGIDISDVSLVINYDMPKTIEDYTHRIGRTGRAGKTGVAISFVTPEDEHLYFDLRNMLLKTKNSVPKELSKHDASHSKGPIGHSKRKREETLFL